MLIEDIAGGHTHPCVHVESFSPPKCHWAHFGFDLGNRVLSPIYLYFAKGEKLQTILCCTSLKNIARTDTH